MVFNFAPITGSLVLHFLKNSFYPNASCIKIDKLRRLKVSEFINNWGDKKTFIKNKQTGRSKAFFNNEPFGKSKAFIMNRQLGD
jgi:hypothetical protein